jgi:hypothetical protein
LSDAIQKRNCVKLIDHLHTGRYSYFQMQSNERLNYRCDALTQINRHNCLAGPSQTASGCTLGPTQMIMSLAVHIRWVMLQVWQFQRNREWKKRRRKKAPLPVDELFHDVNLFEFQVLETYWWRP